MRYCRIKSIVLMLCFMQFTMHASQKPINEQSDNKQVELFVVRLSAAIELFARIQHNATTLDAKRRLLGNLIAGLIPEHDLYGSVSLVDNVDCVNHSDQFLVVQIKTLVTKK